jgi:hypothetical protein
MNGNSKVKRPAWRIIVRIQLSSDEGGAAGTAREQGTKDTQVRLQTLKARKSGRLGAQARLMSRFNRVTGFLASPSLWQRSSQRLCTTRRAKTLSDCKS